MTAPGTVPGAVILDQNPAGIGPAIECQTHLARLGWGESHDWRGR